MYGLEAALRQYRHNNSEGFVCGYDVDETHKVVEQLQRDNAELRATVEALREVAEESFRGWCNNYPPHLAAAPYAEINKTKAQHLNDLKSNVVNECADSFGDRPIDYDEIKEYARKLKQ